MPTDEALSLSQQMLCFALGAIAVAVLLAGAIGVVALISRCQNRLADWLARRLRRTPPEHGSDD